MLLHKLQACNLTNDSHRHKRNFLPKNSFVLVTEFRRDKYKILE
jgi:hypothetical protein